MKSAISWAIIILLTPFVILGFVFGFARLAIAIGQELVEDVRGFLGS